MNSRRLAQQIIEKQCDNVTELIRVKEILHSVQEGLADKKEVEKLSNAISKLDELIETL